MYRFRKAYKIDENNKNFDNESYMNFCLALVNYCNENGGKIYKNSITIENKLLTNEETKEKEKAKVFTCLLTILDSKEIVNNKKKCRIQQKNITNENGIIRKG